MEAPPTLHWPLTPEDLGLANQWTNEVIDNPPNPIRNVVFIHGWTLNSENPGWYQDAAAWLQKYYGVTVTVLDMPNSEQPNPTAWFETLDAAITCPETTLVVGHSLGFVTALNWAHRKIEDSPRFRLAGLASVAGNINYVGFDEIFSHFDTEAELQKKLATIGQHVGRVALMYGKLDPFVSRRHGEIIAASLGRSFQLLYDEAHFSGEHTTENGVVVPPCDDAPALKSFLGNLIAQSDPRRFPKEKMTTLLVLNPRTREWELPLWLDWAVAQNLGEDALRRQMALFRK